MRVHRDRIGLFDPEKRRTPPCRDAEETAEARVRVEPEPLRPTDLRDRVQLVDGPGPGRTRRGHHGDRREAGGPVGRDPVGQLSDVHREIRTDADHPYPGGRQTRHHGRLQHVGVPLGGHVQHRLADSAFLGPADGADQGHEISRRAAGGQVAVGTRPVPQHRAEPPDDVLFDLLQTRGGGPGAGQPGQRPCDEIADRPLEQPARGDVRHESGMRVHRAIRHRLAEEFVQQLADVRPGRGNGVLAQLRQNRRNLRAPSVSGRADAAGRRVDAVREVLLKRQYVFAGDVQQLLDLRGGESQPEAGWYRGVVAGSGQCPQPGGAVDRCGVAVETSPAAESIRCWVRVKSSASSGPLTDARLPPARNLGRPVDAGRRSGFRQPVESPIERFHPPATAHEPHGIVTNRRQRNQNSVSTRYWAVAAGCARPQPSLHDHNTSDGSTSHRLPAARTCGTAGTQSAVRSPQKRASGRAPFRASR